MAAAIGATGEREEPYWARGAVQVLDDLETSDLGLSSAEAEALWGKETRSAL